MNAFSWFKKRHEPYWIIFGLSAYSLTALYGAISSFDRANSIGANLYVLLDWIAATIPYFFLGALVGFCFDKYRRHEKVSLRRIPLWVWLTVLMWLSSSIVSLTTSSYGQMNIIIQWLFPLAYGIFFIGASYVSTFPLAITKTLLGKVLFDLVLLGLFSFWFVQAQQQKKKASYYWLTAALFYVVLEGAILSAILFTN